MVTLPIEVLPGSDGRWHPVAPGTSAPNCVWSGSRHRQSILYWTDGVVYRMQPPPGVDPRFRGSTSRTVTWSVQLNGPAWGGPLADVPRVARCPSWVDYWPQPADATPIGRVRATLIRSLTEACSICGAHLGQFVDHDHRTGLARGWLCRDCNTRVERCRHRSR